LFGPTETRDCRLANSLNFNLITELLIICKLHNIDIIHCSVPDFFQLPLKIVSNILNIPLVVMFHTNAYEYFELHNDLPICLYLFPQYIVNLTANPDLILFPSNAFAKSFDSIGVLPSEYNAKILPIYTNAQIFYPSEPTQIHEWTVGKTKLLYVGRVELEKNIVEILDVMDDTMSLCIVGKGNDTERLRQIVIDRNLDVKIVGLVDNDKLRYWYSSADIVVMPSRTETLGFTTLEAIACGAVVVARNEGGTMDIIQHQYNGLLYNTTAELKAHINIDTVLRNNIIQNCRVYTETHSMEASLDWLYNQYQQLIQQRQMN
jgi:glycosyltransferase involved in cell wall biosynthesis